jgi:solute carrier family 31 (copper transporter), member 1
MSHEHGDMNMDRSPESMVMMVPWLHFTPGDTLLFKGWVPKKPGPIFGACLALFVLAMIDRWLAAVRRFMELWWAEQ